MAQVVSLAHEQERRTSAPCISPLPKYTVYISNRGISFVIVDWLDNFEKRIILTKSGNALLYEAKGYTLITLNEGDPEQLCSLVREARKHKFIFPATEKPTKEDEERMISFFYLIDL